MTNSQSVRQVDRYTQISELAANVRRMLTRFLPVLGIALALESGHLAIAGRPGASAFVMIAASTWAALAIWGRNGKGLPLLPVLAVQNLVIYGLPIALGHEVVVSYKPEYVSRAGFEVLIFTVCSIVGWQIGIASIGQSAPVSYALIEVNRQGLKGLKRLGFGLIAITIAYQVLQSLSLVDFLFRMLPSGANSIIVALVSAAGACGFFLVALSLGSGALPRQSVFLFWALLTLNCMISSAGLLLSVAAIDLIAVVIGLFWGSGKAPWKFVIIVGVALSFLNLGKLSMRNHYWGAEMDEASAASVGLSDLPGRYVEWAQASYDAIGQTSETPGFSNTSHTADATGKQSLLDRIDNLQNLLFAIDAVERGHISTLNGATYKVIPALIVPRILWPDKPRTHEGQIMLNVHFGRQDLDSTYRTYVAWGLLPEAYGNFGAITGSVLLGLVLGVIFAWIEQQTARKLMISIEGFLAFDLLLNLTNSFEMVSSVFVTSTIQSIVPIIIACLPFVRRMRVDRPNPEQP